ncbi:(2E,6E)-farnesyl diphosphate synthase [Echinimonas agarilytica]|uniref:(2E,6E)-farnesyl diphosphate synthase n=1 Tax=Echinimonas agarilytica TaxID=1215918 RepID=A0AA42B863_9GAMM|nr:(2E,6E)-farnesyl diphosphate synthase [Echinimonas agarilytica]MCM2680544.1 (2E,6E)-farnesyl diphosphate synthase [Echinimonas agarilytica]
MIETQQNLADYQDSVRQRIDEQLSCAINTLADDTPQLKAAMRHGLLLGGKRVRPFMVYAVGDMLDVPQHQLDAAACAIECIHAYSLIHDDLPAMDDDDLRRGKPTCHVAFDEATAILAGDALQTLAFDLLSTPIEGLNAEQQLRMVKSLSQASGYIGMCGGQAMDLDATDKSITLEQLEAIHRAKTGALLQCSVDLAALAANIEPKQHLQLIKFARDIGLAFQVQDDILDVTSDTETLGKPQGSDIEANKSTYPSLLGLDGARQKADTLLQSSLQALRALPYNSDLLANFAHYIITRNY